MKRSRKKKGAKTAIARMILLIAMLPLAFATIRHVTGNSLVVEWRIPRTSASSWLSVNFHPADQGSHKAELDGGWVFRGPQIAALSKPLRSLGIPDDERTFTLHLSDTLTVSKTDLPKSSAKAHVAQQTVIARHADTRITASASSGHKQVTLNW